MISIAQFGMILLLTLFLILHIMIMMKIIPYALVWGGRLKSDRDMFRFELFSIIINVLMILIILEQASFVDIGIPGRFIPYSLWFMAGMFFLNSLGNAKSKNRIERWFFTPVTIALTIFSCILAYSN